MLNEVGRCTSFGEQQLQFRENVNKRIGMCEHLLLQVEKDKGKGAMDIDLRSVAAVTTLGGGITLINLCMSFDFPQLLAEHSYQIESQHSYCPNDDKPWCKYHKDKIVNTSLYDRSKCLPFVFRGKLHVNVGSLKIRTSPLTT